MEVDLSDYPIRGAAVKWPNKKVGDEIGNIWPANSDFRKKLEELAAGGKNYVQFAVFADSFEVYLAARKIADDLKLEAGWVPFENDTRLTWGGAAGVD